MKEVPSLVQPERLVHSDLKRMGGTPVFVGTRVPVSALFDYLLGNHPIDEFFDDFPGVAKEQAISVLEQANQMLIYDTHSS